jgi:WD40-like Beta Propeller Repeat
VIPVAGGTPNAITAGLAPDLESGDHLSFSADGKQIAFAGDYSNPGIFTVPVAGGTATQLTSDYDYWPSFSADGSKVYFSRDASSTNADDNASAPVAPVDTDLYELWSMKSDGTGQAVVAEGDFENLVLAAIATSAASSPTTPAAAPATPTATTTTPATGPGTTKKGTPTITTPTVKTAGKPHAGSARSVSVTSKGPRHLVKWSGRAAAWNVILKIGKKTHTARVKGSVHSHVFVLPGAHGAVSARVLTV